MVEFSLATFKSAAVPYVFSFIHEIVSAFLIFALNINFLTCNFANLSNTNKQTIYEKGLQFLF